MYLYKRCFDLCYDMIDVCIYNLKYKTVIDGIKGK